MSPEKNKQTLLTVYQKGFMEGDLAALDALVTADRPDHEQSFPPELTTGREGLKNAIRTLRAAFPDIKFTAQFMVAEGDKVAALVKIEGTQKGEFLGAPATGKRFVLETVDVVRYADDGRINEHWGFLNMPAIMKQLGIAPPAGR